MQVQVHTGKGVTSGTDWMEQELLDALSRFEQHLIRVEVHVSDQNGEKTGGDDIKCVMDAQVAGLRSQVATHRASNVHDAYRGALHTLARSLDAAVDKSTQRGRDSIRRPEMMPQDSLS